MIAEDRLRDAMGAYRDAVVPSPTFFQGVGERARWRRRQHRRHATTAVAAAILIFTVAVGVTRHHQTSPTRPAHRPAPSGHLYWWDSTGIERANLDGTDVVSHLIPTASLQALPCGLAVDPTYVYWNHPGGFARAKRDGTGLDTGFITDLSGPDCLAVDGAHIYWTTTWKSIGRANLDGTDVQQGFISDVPNQPSSLAVEGGHIYWENATSIGRANVDGTGVNQDFITGLGPNPPLLTSSPQGAIGIVVDRAHIYWGNSDGTIGRANLDGTGINRSFIRGPVVAGRRSFICAHDSHYVYWVNEGPAGPRTPPFGPWIGRARLDGTSIKDDFITASASACAIGP